MAQRKAAPLLGRLAVHLKMITMEQLTAVLHDQSARPDAKLGELMIEAGLIDQGQLVKLTAAQAQVVAKQRAVQAAARTPQAEKPGASPAPRAAKPAAAPQAPATPGPGPAKPAPPVEKAPPPSLFDSEHDESAAAPPRVAAPQPAPARAEPAAAAASPAPAKAQPAAAAASPAPATRDHVDDREGPAPLGRVEDWAEPGDADRQRFLALLGEAVRRDASDVHLHPGSPILARVGGRMEPLEEAPLTPADSERLLLSVLEPDLRRQLAESGELDGCQSFEGVGRFRANFYREQRGLDGVLRRIPAEPPTLDDLGLPSGLAKFTTYHQGMVLVTGPSGCGKSSTLAALVNLVNEERREHILTIEDPIETLHASKRCMVNQRSAGHHTQSFSRALRAALREDPDVIVIGELRDLETVSLALSAAETGHFVLATLHTDNAIRTVNRLVGSFPADEQDQVRAMLSESLKGVISQRLLTRADGAGRVPALETMVVTRAISNLIRENKTFQIHSILQTGKKQGMALLDQSIRELVQSGVVSQEEANRHLEDTKAQAA